MNWKVLDYLRSLGFGGLVGSGIAGFLYSRYPNLFPNTLDLKFVVVIGGCTGAACQRLIESLVKFILRPLSDTSTYYEKLDELIALRKTNQISDAQFQYIVSKLTEQRFLGNVRTVEAKTSSLPHENSTPKSLQ